MSYATQELSEKFTKRALRNKKLLKVIWEQAT